MISKIILLLLLGCTSTTEKTEVIWHNGISDDEVYVDALRKFTRSVKVYSNFETLYTIHVTYLSPEFMQAFNTRMERFIHDMKSTLNKSSAHLGFFVSIFTPEEGLRHLSDPAIWDIYHETNQIKNAPTTLKALRDKDHWKPFFPQITPWSQEYFILFEDPSGETKRNLEQSFNVVFANAYASSKLLW